MKHQYYFAHQPLRPFEENLLQLCKQEGWESAKTESVADFKSTNIGVDEKAAEWLEYKDKLAIMLKSSGLSISPETWCINDHNYYPIINSIKNKESEIGVNKIWIYKPAMQNNGENIRIFRNATEIAAHYMSASRQGGPHVLQSYINNPKLIDGRKATFRFYTIITSELNCFLYRKGYYNTSIHPYDANNYDIKASHITNEHVSESESEDEKNNKQQIIQTPSEEYPDEDIIYQKVLDIVTKVMRAFKVRLKFENQTLGKPQFSFDIFGFDFIQDIDGHLWLLEVNHGPWFPCEKSHALYEPLYQYLWKDIYHKFILNDNLSSYNFVPIENHGDWITFILSCKLSFKSKWL